mgnify:FL=1
MKMLQAVSFALITLSVVGCAAAPLVASAYSPSIPATPKCVDPANPTNCGSSSLTLALQAVKENLSR